VGRAGITGEYTSHVLDEPMTESIGRLAERIKADVILTGRHGDSDVPMARPVGGTAFAIITRSRVPCLAVTIPMTMPLRQVLVAIDFSETSRGALIVGLSWASALRDRNGTAPVLTALHIRSDAVDAGSPDALIVRDVNHELDLLRRNAGDWAGVDVRGVTTSGTDVAGAIATHATAQHAELVVLGTRGGNPQRAPDLGSVSAAVLGKVNAPVLLVPPAVWADYAKDMT